ncbi:MAG: hypothetical protein KAI47_06255 [Deltaproteobacteria bacterium]|nr:hypothetical protein [Deltaproteobacteria bacterium]
MKRSPSRRQPSLLLGSLLALALGACSPNAPTRPSGPATPPVSIGPAHGGKADGFDWGSPCRAGSGTFSQPIAKDAVVTVGTIPKGRVGVEIHLTSPEDVDVQLYDADGTAIVQWPNGILSGASQESTTYKGVTITWSGYNGDGTNLGHETLRITGETPTSFEMRAYGYAAGAAQVDYTWTAKPDCEDKGAGSFEQTIEKDAVVTVGTIPKGLKNVRIALTSPVDIDVQLYDAVDGTAVVKWPGGLLDSATKASTTYGGVEVTWSGYNGDGTGKGNEYIHLTGTTSRSLIMKVFGYEAGTAKVAYSWGNAGTTAPTPKAEVVFAPAQRHEDRVVELIKGAKHSIDIAMYNFKHSGILAALRDAIATRHVKVRMIYHGAQNDRNDPAGSRSAGLEEAGVDVRFATKSKVMHHKFMIVDGPRAEDDGTIAKERAKTAWLVSGSGNWALGNHDENTLFLTGTPELVQHFQSEFNRLWTYSWDFSWKSFDYRPAAVLDPTTFVDDPNEATFFTSSNMKENMSFTVKSGSAVVGHAIAAELEKATTSIDIASGHMRSQIVYDTLVRIAKDPTKHVAIRVYVDGQEYTTSTYKAYYAYRLHAAGIPIKFKYYAYRWDYHYAPQMHNKYFIIDGKTLLSGSYNLSENAEIGSIENVIEIKGSAFQDVIKRYSADFSRLWNTQQDGKALAALEEKIQTASTIPLVFAPMALTHPQIKALKSLISANCPAADKSSSTYNPDYGKNPAHHRSCPRS